jgi:hypothetical protein
MDKIASPQDLQAELRRLLAYTQTEKPSREKLAAEMRELAARIEKVAARKGEVIESKRWKHKESGATASLFGAVPWSGAPGDRKEDWQLEGVGWTIRWDDGTVGIGRQPFKSKAEAEEHLEKMRGKGLAK